jgi:small-conductance mechanosensitive channel
LGSLETRFRWSCETTLTTARGVTAALWLIVATLLLELWGVGLGGIWTVLVSIATVIGVGFLATWAMVSNVTASVFIGIWKPFHLGDTVEILPET